MKNQTKIKNKLFFNIKKTAYFPIFLVILGIFLLPKNAYLSSITPDNIISLTNAERQKAGLNPVRLNSQLTAAAEKKAQAIYENQVFAHNINNRKFSEWVKEASYDYAYVGENLAINFMTSEGVVAAWMASPTHRKNVINENFDEIGLAVLDGKFENSDSIIIVQIFGKTKNSDLAEVEIKKTITNPEIYYGLTSNNDYYLSQKNNALDNLVASLSFKKASYFLTALLILV